MGKLQSIQSAFEKRLLANTPVGVETAFEGTDYKPKPNVPYQIARVFPGNPINNTLGDDFYLETGRFQVLLAYPKNKGKGAVLDRADEIRTAFKRGTFLLEDGIRMHVLQTPSVQGATITEDRIVVPVTINFTAEIYSV